MSKSPQRPTPTLGDVMRSLDVVRRGLEKHGRQIESQGKEIATQGRALADHEKRLKRQERTLPIVLRLAEDVAKVKADATFTRQTLEGFESMVSKSMTKAMGENIERARDAVAAQVKAVTDKIDCLRCAQKGPKEDGHGT